MPRPVRSRSRRLLRANDSGAALVEFAIVVPVLLVLLLGVAEIGRALWHHHALTKGVRDATRYLTRVPAGADCAIDADPYQRQARNLVLYGDLEERPEAPLIAGWTNGGDIAIELVAWPNPPGPDRLRGPDPLCGVRVTATPSLPFPLLGFMPSLPTSLTLSVRDEMRHIGG